MDVNEYLMAYVCKREVKAAATAITTMKISTHVNIFLQTIVTKQTKQKVRKNNRSRTSDETKIYQTTIDEHSNRRLMVRYVGEVGMMCVSE